MGFEVSVGDLWLSGELPGRVELQQGVGGPSNGKIHFGIVAGATAFVDSHLTDASRVQRCGYTPTVSAEVPLVAIRGAGEHQGDV